MARRAWLLITDLVGRGSLSLAVFRYSTPEHDVVQVDARGYAECVAPDNAVLLTSGNDHVVLGQAGRFFFICDTEGECSSGLKLTVNVH